MLRKVQVMVAVALGSFLPTSGAAAQEVCPPADDTSEPDEDDPAITGLRWPNAREVLVESGFEVEVLPAGLRDGIEDLASVVRWGVDTPFDDVNPEVAVVCLGRLVPDVFGSTESAAAAALASVGFAYTATESGGEQRRVAEQSPAAGTLLYLGTPVQIVLADPRVPVPDLIGLSPADAEVVLADSGLVLGGVDGEADRPIVAQNPLAGELVEPGRSVSIGTEPVVPNSTGGTTVTSPPATVPSETTVNTTTESTIPPATSDTPPPWRAAAVAGAGATALAALGVAGARRHRSRWRRRITTVTTHDPPTSVVEDSQELAHVTRIECTAAPPIDRIEENHS